MSSTQYKSGCNFCPPRNEFAVVAENGRAVAIICDTAKSWGHSLIIPKEHSSNLASAGMDETIWREGIVPLLREVIEKFKKNPSVIGFHINSNAGSSAEQSVFHTHIHVVPKYKKGKGEWITFLNGGNFTSESSKLFSGRWDANYQNMMNHINDCLQKGSLNKSVGGAIESFNFLARIGDGELGSEEHFWFIPKTTTSSYHWGGGTNCKHYNFQERQKIAQMIKSEQWGEEKASFQEKGNNKKREKNGDFKEKEEPKDHNNSQEQNQNTDRKEPGNNQESPHNKESGNENDKGKNNQSQEENKENEKKGKKSDDWRETLKGVDNSLEQTFDDAKISEWQDREKGPFNTVDGVKNLLESVKENNKFLAEIKSKHSASNLSNLIANKSPQQVIIIVKRFEYDGLSDHDKEIKDKKMKVYYKQLNQLAKNGKLTEEQINGYLYKQAIGEINESSIKIENEQKNIKPSESNLAKSVKIIGIISLILVGGFFLILFVRRRKKTTR